MKIEDKSISEKVFDICSINLNVDWSDKDPGSEFKAICSLVKQSPTLNKAQTEYVLDMIDFDLEHDDKGWFLMDRQATIDISDERFVAFHQVLERVDGFLSDSQMEYVNGQVWDLFDDERERELRFPIVSDFNNGRFYAIQNHLNASNTSDIADEEDEFFYKMYTLVLTKDRNLPQFTTDTALPKGKWLWWNKS